MSTDERPPPLHSRVLTTLRDAFFPAAFVDYLRDEWELWKTVSRQVDEEAAAEDPDYARLLEQRRIAREFKPGTDDLSDFIRRYWEAGKPKPSSPQPPTNQ